MNRRLLAAGAFVLLAALAGCSTILGPGEPDPSKINQNATYGELWDSETNVTIVVRKREYAAVYNVGNQSQVELYRRDALGTESPLDIRAVKFQYPNGTVENVSVDQITLQRKQALVDLPARNGKLAFTAPRTGKEFSTPAFVTGSYRVRLPPGARVGVPILAQVRPRGYEATRSNGNVTLAWEDVQTRSLSVRYYLARDLLLFGGMAAILVVAASGGAIYYLRQIRALERRREEVGLDVETEDDDLDDGGPPPGMR